jgi:diadenosine tetraphosphatase ApaH/serine/threonine PP2A family protein phosphatase
MTILVLSDIHGNLAALQAVLAAAGSIDAIWNIGDTVGYGPHPGECIDLLVERGARPSLVGNHDLACLGSVDLAEFNPTARAAVAWTAARLAPHHLAYLTGLPSMTVADGFTLAHASPRAPVWEYVLDARVATANFAHFETAVCLIGHTHVALSATLRPGAEAAEVRRLEDGETLDLDGPRLLVNPGSVGQPRDRDPRAAFALIDTERQTLTARRVAYDIAATQRDMARAGLPTILADRLALGR